MHKTAADGKEAVGGVSLGMYFANQLWVYFFFNSNGSANGKESSEAKCDAA